MCGGWGNRQLSRHKSAEIVYQLEYIFSLSLSTPGTSWKGEGRGGENFSLIENIDFVATFHIRHILRMNSKQIDGDLGHYNTVVDSF